MELNDLATSLGVKNIVVSHINSNYYKDDITIVINDYLVLNLMGKTISFIPLTIKGVGKELSRSYYVDILNRVKDRLKGESF